MSVFQDHRRITEVFEFLFLCSFTHSPAKLCNIMESQKAKITEARERHFPVQLKIAQGCVQLSFGSLQFWRPP